MTVPREFVLMDRAAIGLGGVFLHLRAELNFHRLFEEAMEKFSVAGVAERQANAMRCARTRAWRTDAAELSTAVRWPQSAGWTFPGAAG